MHLVSPLALNEWLQPNKNDFCQFVHRKKKTHTYFYSQRTISAAIPWDAWTAWPQNPPWGCLPCRSWSSQPCLHKKWVAEFRSGTQRHLSQKRRHLNCQTICFPTVCKAHMAIPYHSINRPVAIAVFACNRCLLRMLRSSWDHPEYVISFCWASNCPMPSQKTCKKKFSSTLYYIIYIYTYMNMNIYIYIYIYKYKYIDMNINEYRYINIYGWAALTGWHQNAPRADRHTSKACRATRAVRLQTIVRMPRIKEIPSRKPTYPTWGKGKSSSNMPLCLIRGIC